MAHDTLPDKGVSRPVSPDITFDALRARVQALGYRLFVTTEGTQLVIDDNPPGPDPYVEVVFIHEDGDNDDLEDWLKHEEADGTQHLDGIRLQAERVVRAYHELRADAHSANFQSGDFPVGLFAALVEQIKLLEGWLEPSEPDDDDLLKRDFCDRTTADEQDLMYSIQGVANAIYKIDTGGNFEGLAIALKKLVDELAGEL